MAPHSSTLAWKIPWTEEPGRLQSMGLLKVGHDWVTSLSLFTFLHWRRKWQPTPVFLPGESQGRGSLVSCHLWGHTESDTTEVTQHCCYCEFNEPSFPLAVFKVFILTLVTAAFLYCIQALISDLFCYGLQNLLILVFRSFITFCEILSL